ncbi:MAG: hypothetical protein KA419_13330 [Acidobacteria bacterium]|nr:hypothetical protein [Acidobacteriota bacterium]
MKRLIVIGFVLCLALSLPVVAADKKKDEKKDGKQAAVAAQPQGDPKVETLRKIQEGYLQLQQNQGSAQDLVLLVEDYLVKYPDTPEVTNVHVVGVFAYQKLDNFEKFEHHSLKAIEKLPAGDHQAPMFAVTLAGRYFEKGEFAKSEELYNKAMSLIPGLTKPAEFPQERWDAFIGQMKWQIFAGLGDDHYKLALKFDREKQKAERMAMLEKCIADMNDAIKLNPKDDYSYMILGSAMALHEQYEESLKVFAKAVVMGGQMAESAKGKMENIIGALKNADKLGDITMEKLLEDAKKELGIS